MHHDVDETDADYAARLGDRLRSLRHQQHLSLYDVEAASDREFKASVLGAYERGDRTMSVPRLQRLARLYRVPVDQMLPTDDAAFHPTGDAGRTIDLTAPADGPHHDDQPVAIDIAAVEQLTLREGAILARYLYTIQIQRGDHSNRVLTIRDLDLTPIAGIIGCLPDQVPAQLDALGVRPSPDPPTP
jgi:transcriptional regulator with XRE-family HTH domain